MKSYQLKWFFSVVVLMMYSCENDTTDIQNDELSDFAREYIGMRVGAQNAMTERQSGAINKSFQNLYGMFPGVATGSIDSDSTGTAEPGDPGSPGDSTVYEDPKDTTLYVDPWVSCAIISETSNEDGSITTVMDYGDGCDEGWGDWKYRMWGKITSTYLYQNSVDGSRFSDNYFYDSEYDHYGGYYYYDSTEWEMNGESHYEGQSTYDTTSYAFSGWYLYDDYTTYRWDESTYTYRSEGKTSYDESHWVTEYSNYEYSEGVDYYYRSTVIEPLVMDYTCSSSPWMVREAIAEDNANGIMYIFTYVSGVEEVHYRQGDEEGHFMINYGDGECDNIITITENGITVTINLEDSWDTPEVHVKAD